MKGDRACRGQEGFTLLELLVTMALLGIIVAISLPHVMTGGGALQLASDARVLAGRIRAARERALSSREMTRVTINLLSPAVAGPGAERAVSLTATERVIVRTPKGLVEDASAVILFRPDGSSSGGSITLEGHGRTRRLQVDWLTGAVSADGATQ